MGKTQEKTQLLMFFKTRDEKETDGTKNQLFSTGQKDLYFPKYKTATKFTANIQNTVITNRAKQ